MNLILKPGKLVENENELILNGYEYYQIYKFA